MANVTGPVCFKTRKAMLSFLSEGGYVLDSKYGIWVRADGHEVTAGYTQHCGYHVTVERF